MANQISVLLDPTQMPNQSQDQATFDKLWAAVLAALPTLGSQINTVAANLNSLAYGGAYAIPYTFDTGTADADPGSGKIRLDNAAAQSSSAWIYVDVLSSTAQDVTAQINSFGSSTSATKGQVKLVKQGDPSRWIVANITAVNAGSGYMKLQISAIQGSQTNPFVSGDAVILQYQRTGDKGDTGNLSFPNLYVRYEVASGTAAESLAAGTWTSRSINTVKTNNISGASVASNLITLPAGTYEYTITVPGTNCNVIKARLYNNTDATVVDYGTSESSSTTYPSSVRSIIRGQVTIAAAKALYVQAWTAISGAGGAPTSIAGVNEVYTEANFRKIA